MTPEQLKSAAIEMWGERGWITALSSCLKIDRTQVWRYMGNKSDISGPIEAAVACWLSRFRSTGIAPTPTTMFDETEMDGSQIDGVGFDDT